MKKVIWKYELLPSNDTIVLMPRGAEILCINSQKETACIWALVDPDAQKEKRRFEVFGTGHPIRFDMGVQRYHIGTFQLHNGDLVFHVFERTE